VKFTHLARLRRGLGPGKYAYAAHVGCPVADRSQRLQEAGQPVAAKTELGACPLGEHFIEGWPCGRRLRGRRGRCCFGHLGGGRGGCRGIRDRRRLGATAGVWGAAGGRLRWRRARGLALGHDSRA
jgi:hypothetical protein